MTPIGDECTNADACGDEAYCNIDGNTPVCASLIANDEMCSPFEPENCASEYCEDTGDGTGICADTPAAGEGDLCTPALPVDDASNDADP